MSFAALTQRAQVARLRPSALEALRAYPFTVRRLRLLNHGFNTTFRVDTEEGPSYALRINVNSRRSPQQIGAEMAWLAALAEDTDLCVPVPQPTRDGHLMRELWSPALDRALPVAVFSWLPGPNLGAQATPDQMREVGRAAATLHAHARRWTLPAGTSLSSLRAPLMDSPNRLEREHELLTPERREVVSAALARVEAALGRVYAQDTPRVLHADLHNWNLKWSRGRLSVFDFDDSGVGVPMQDLAISAYYLRPKEELEAELLEGYASATRLPTFAQADYEAVVAGRALVLLNDLLENTTAELRALLPRYVPNSVTKLRHYLETGVFRHDVQGLIPA
ncbi:Ser/Thr protein kinase RdoA (MazF antagonist) [Deinococcus metalli]|uniref:Aminoglycoside phosphotransferase n=1 Tax=Deinococcus metalli TaxID=1141878 RepID=A0A7W8KFS8_9DEIO|nr:phosphotransferase [Deinococcus metalli]MBB5377351.1 Ser/Thr protein kinase RdoA (MazF antagonist) [Deinococcus metalli]GHF49808.1 aminoglycoside phosphotransferase [Deinococcus metalli]